MFKKRAESVINAELAWKDFHQEVPHASVDRFIRVNPKTKYRTPRMDDKSLIHVLHDEIRTGLGLHDMPMKIKNIARRLVASSFYFEKVGPSRQMSEQRIMVQGMF